MNTQINISKAQFGYDNKQVLSVSDINFVGGKIYFLLGKSGTGKSTFLEGVGLMNNNISKSSINFCINNNTQDITELWNSTDNIKAKYRRQYFTFIFQDCNLLQNFTAGLNMSLAGLLTTQDYSNIQDRVFELMDELDLPRSIFDQKITELSGGQKQRLSFIRALCKDFKFLFADEPTGNLDTITAQFLCKAIKNRISKEKIAIIVTHNISLALMFADEILIIKQGLDKVASLNKENVLIKTEKQNWTSLGNDISKPYLFIEQLLK